MEPFFLQKQVTFHVNHPVSEVIERLSTLIHQSVFIYYGCEDGRSMLARGRFSIMRFGWLANSGRPVIKGKILDGNGRTTIEIYMTLKSTFLKAFVWLMYVIHFAVCTTAIVLVSLGHPMNYTIGLFLLAVEVLMFAFPLWLFHSEAKLAESVLRRALA